MKAPKTVLKILVVLLIALALTEGAFRLYNKIRPSFIFSRGTYNRFRGRPYAQFYGATLNSRGFLDVEHPIERPEGVFRIVAIGDSFAFGVVPYENNFLTLLEEDLNAQAGGRHEVINMGISGISPSDYLQIFRDEGLAYGPDMVVVSFFVGNDIDSKIQEDMDREDPLYVISFIKYTSRLIASYRENALDVAKEYQDDKPSRSQNDFLSIEMDRSAIYCTDKEAAVRIQGGKGGTTASRDEVMGLMVKNAVKPLAYMNEICRRNHMGFLVVVIPDELQVNPRLQSLIRTMTNCSEYDFKRPSRLVSKWLSSYGIRHIDLLDSFVQGQKQLPLYKPMDTHWNVAGNRLASKAIAAYLVENGFLELP